MSVRLPAYVHKAPRGPTQPEPAFDLGTVHTPAKRRQQVTYLGRQPLQPRLEVRAAAQVWRGLFNQAHE